MSIINDEAKEIMLEKIKEFHIPSDEINYRNQMRNDFISIFTKEKIKELTPGEYFLGEGKKDCMSYQLEWATIKLGSIRGGSNAKFGAKEQFSDIKKLLIDLTSLSDQQSVFYKTDGSLTEMSKKLVSESSKIKGMITGRTVLGKLLSIYYPNTFIPIFSDQYYLLNKIIKGYSEDIMGLELYFKNNYLFLKIKEEISEEPAFEIQKEQFTNDFLYKFLYYCYPHSTREGEPIDEEKSEQEEKIEALETEHYQKLIHRNFEKLFKNYRYYEEEYQKSHEGHYATEEVGIMDFLCLDERNNIVVFELKRKGTDETLAQLCRYMGWAKENLAKNDQKVLGMVISESKDIRLEYAIKVVPNVTLRQMKLKVSIENF